MMPTDIVCDALGRRVVLLYNRDARHKTLVNTVLQAFREMGASDDEIVDERMRLHSDRAHYIEWIVSLPDWHDAAIYVTE